MLSGNDEATSAATREEMVTCAARWEHSRYMFYYHGFTRELSGFTPENQQAKRDRERSSQIEKEEDTEINWIEQARLFYGETVTAIIISFILLGKDDFKGGLYRIQILCRWYPFWSYPPGNNS